MVRARSTQAHEKVLKATFDLFVKRGIDATSMDAVAEKSGVSKATIYKHWHDKDALALESLSLMFGLEEEPPRFDSGDLRQDLVDALTYRPAAGTTGNEKSRDATCDGLRCPQPQVRRAMAFTRDRTPTNPAEEFDQARKSKSANWLATST